MRTRLLTAIMFLTISSTLSLHATADEKRRQNNDEVLKRMSRLAECRDKIGEVRQYIEICARVIRGFESTTSKVIMSGVHYNRGLGFLILGEPQNAIADFSAAIRVSSNWPDAYIGRGIAYSMLGDDRRSLEDFDAAVRWSKFAPIALTFYNRSLSHTRLKDAANAKRDFDTAVSLDPSRSWERAYKIGQAWFAPPPKDY